MEGLGPPGLPGPTPLALGQRGRFWICRRKMEIYSYLVDRGASDARYSSIKENNLNREIIFNKIILLIKIDFYFLI